MKPILLIFGPSGVGKSTLAEWVADDFGFLHINFDNWDGKGLDGKTMDIEFNRLFQNYQSKSLRLIVDYNIKKYKKKGAILTFPSNYIPNIEHIKAAELFGIKTIILYGPHKNCLDSFIEREKKTSRCLPVAHWNKYNEHIYDGSSIKKEHTPYIINAFLGINTMNISMMAVL